MTDEIRAQDGPQSEFLATTADIAIYGGSAGGGKSFALLLDPLYDWDNPKFGGVIFRRTSPELTGAGSLWEEAQNIYRAIGARLTETPTLSVEFPAGGLIQLLHLQHVSDVYAHQGKQYAFIGIDELTHFEESQFWYLVSRLRTISGADVRMRCTTNPDPDSFVRKLIEWWIDDETGIAIKERSGVLRWFIRDGNTIVWAGTAEELLPQCRPGQRPMSMTFIRAELKDNPALTSKDPGYESRIQALPDVERLRLGVGNWNVREQSGKYVKREYFLRRYDGCPIGCIIAHDHKQLPKMNVYIASDFAVTEPGAGRDPDFTEHGVFGVDASDDIYVLDWWSGQTTAEVWVEVLIDKMARWRPQMVFGEAGVIRRSVEPFLERRMRERRVYATLRWISAPHAEQHGSSKQGFDDRSKRAKAVKGRAFQARAAMGKVLFPSNEPWADRVIDQCVGFPGVRYDDAFDAVALMCLGIDEAVGATPEKPVDTRRPDKWKKAFAAKKNVQDRWKVV